MTDFSTSCPLPKEAAARISLAHGEGGRLTRQLLRDHILRSFGTSTTDAWADAAQVEQPMRRLALTTDSFVVTPRFFPGGDLGKLAVFGTVNDLAVSGACPRWLTLGIIVEEGFLLAELDRILASVATSAAACRVRIVAGDTKVVPRGAVDGVFLHTTGIGEIRDLAPPGAQSLSEGDALLVSGPIGRHGVAVLAARDAFGFLPPPESDCCSLIDTVETLFAQGVVPRVMRDATRGGVAAVLHEWSETCGKTLVIEEGALPVTEHVRGACELLGLDPLHLANEGTMVVAVAPHDVTVALRVLNNFAREGQASVIGKVAVRDIAPVVVRRALGRLQPLDDPLGAPQPRIC